MKYWILSIISIFLIIYFVLQKEANNTINQRLNNEELNKYKQVHDGVYNATFVQSNNLPIVLYNADIRSLGIKEIDIRKRLYDDSLETINTLEQLNPLVSMLVDFNREGTFNRFSFYKRRADDSWKEIIAVTLVQSSTFYTSESTGYWPVFLQHIDTIKLTFIPAPSKINDYYSYESSLDFLSALKISPFIGKDCFLYNTMENSYDGNEILYKKLITYESKYKYPKLKELSRETSLVEKQLKSTSKEITLYELDFLENHYWEYLPISKKVIDVQSDDTLISQFYYYFMNPEIEDNRIEVIEADGEDTAYLVDHYIDYIFLNDTIYNRHLWSGYSDYDYSGRTSIATSGYGYTTYFPNELFEKEKFTKVSKKDFFINGEPGYNYLLNAFNNRELDYSKTHLIKEQYYDSLGNWHPENYKKQKEIEVLKELPKRIVIQLTLTDFWFIEITD